MIPNAIIRQYAVGQQVDAEVADQEIVLHYALALLNEAGLIGRDAQHARAAAVQGRHRAAQVRVREHRPLL